MKYRKWIGFVLALFIILWPTSDKALAATPENLYAEPMVVKLVPSSNFDAAIHGTYELIDLANGKTMDIGSNIKFRYAKDKVIINLANDKTIESTEGFVLQETPVSNQNYVSFTSIFRAGTSFQESKYRGSFVVKPSDGSKENADRLTLFNVLDIEDYLKGVVPKEVSASWPKEALKAQAVAARNYAKVNMSSNDYLYDTVQHQVYHGLSGEHARTNEAIEETKGIYAVHSGSLINAYFHASSGGYTDNSENAWSSTLPYIRATKDPYDIHEANPNTKWSARVTRDEADQAIFPSSEWELSTLEILEKSDAGRVQKMKATAVHSTTGEEQVKILPEGSSPDSLRWSLGTSLKSTMFDMTKKGSGSVSIKMADGSEQVVDHSIGIKMRQKDGSDEAVSYENLAIRTVDGINYAQTAPTTFIFEGQGWGHGLGMSQWGAYKMAQDGKTFREILKHYYAGIEIVKH